MLAALSSLGKVADLLRLALEKHINGMGEAIPGSLTENKKPLVVHSSRV